MDKPEAETVLLYGQRARELAENLMLRQNPSQVNADQAKVVVEAAFTFYQEIDRRVIEAGEFLGTAKAERRTL